jgi:hypothetical protein
MLRMFIINVTYILQNKKINEIKENVTITLFSINHINI